MSVMALDPDATWTAVVGAIPPLPYELKYRLADRWVRFYALPDGKRYPTEDSELIEVIRRGIVLLGDACTTEEQVLVASGCFGARGTAPERDEPSRRAHPEAAYWRECEVGDDEEWVPHLFCSTLVFTDSAVDELLRSVAEEKVVLAMIVAPRKGIVIHPYDGGFDIILPDSKTRDDWRSRHQDWVSHRSDGL